MFGNIWILAVSGDVFEHVWASLRRVGIGYLLGVLTGITLGTIIGLYRIAEDLLEVPLQFVRNITPIAVVPLAMHAFGLEEPSKYFVTFYATIIPVIFNTATGVAATPVIRIRAAMCLGANQRDIFFRVVIPSAWPHIVTGLRIALGFSFMGVVGAEMIGTNEGVGFLIMQSRSMFLPQQMFTGLFLLGILGIATDRAFQFLLNRLMRRYMMMLNADN
jgi:ABC-type nitrate/sulfonate/bicarbonate transport system permease component